MSNWIKVCEISEIPILGARVIKTEDEKDDIAVFRTSDNKIFALKDRCPHKNGPLSQGIVHGNQVTCPLHNWNIDLKTGEAVAPDKGCTGVYQVKIEKDVVYIAK